MVFNFIDLKRKKISKKCKYLSESLIFDCQNTLKFCPVSNNCIIETDFNGIWLDVDKVISTKKELLEKFDNHILDDCQNCEYIADIKENKEPCFKYLYLSNWKNCYINCSYCNFPKEEDLIKANHYDIFPIINQLFDKKLIDIKTKVIFECGDATIHPEFDKILYRFIHLEMKDIEINTPALRYCESISEAIAANIATVIIPLDSGCPYIYEKIKGINKYDIAVANIKRYLSFEEPSQKRVVLKYTIVSGVNDNQKEILDWFMFARSLKIKKLAIDIDLNFYNQVKNSLPQYLKELIIFATNLSDYNNIEIVFCDRVDIIYKSILEEK